jgi:hypothetical protein
MARARRYKNRISRVAGFFYYPRSPAEERIVKRRATALGERHGKSLRKFIKTIGTRVTRAIRRQKK